MNAQSHLSSLSAFTSKLVWSLIATYFASSENIFRTPTVEEDASESGLDVTVFHKSANMPSFADYFMLEKESIILNFSFYSEICWIKQTTNHLKSAVEKHSSFLKYTKFAVIVTLQFALFNTTCISKCGIRYQWVFKGSHFKVTDLNHFWRS